MNRCGQNTVISETAILRLAKQENKRTKASHTQTQPEEWGYRKHQKILKHKTTLRKNPNAQKNIAPAMQTDNSSKS